jgi:nitrogen fixation NifU-like protein
MATKKLYQDILREHYHSPRNRGELADHNLSSGVMNPSCGDVIKVQAYVQDGRIMRIAFIGSGCMISQAAASLWSEYVIGKTVSEIQTLTLDSILTILGIELGPTRARCAFLFIEAIQG